MTSVEALVCTRCDRRYEPEAVEYTCPEHDGVDGVLDVRYDYERALGPNGDGSAPGDHPIPASGVDLWVYEPFLPVDDGSVRLGAGGTPLLSAPTLSDRLGVGTLVKDETGNPTGSTKDRASAVLVARARQRGHDVVTCASTGNAAASLAGYAARAGLDCRIFVPADLPDAKSVQPRLYGAALLAVDGSYEDAYDLCRAVADRRGWYNCNAAMNPYAVEGTRTLGFEIAADAPDADWVAMPMGNGCSLAAVWKGLRESRRLGAIDDPPSLLGVQAAGATAIHDRFVAARFADEDGETESPSPTPAPDGRGRGTAADSIDVHEPHNAVRACRALDESDGDSVVVSDGEIHEAQTLLGGAEGVFVEPASAAALAGVRAARAQGVVDVDDRVVVVATGTGLKDTESAQRGVAERVEVGADPDDVPDEFP